MRLFAFIALACAAAFAGPVEFGLAELQAAVAARGLNPSRFRFKTVVTTDEPDAFRVAPGLITGGSLRGVMYGLLEAAEQIRAAGRIRTVTAVPAAAIRGARLRTAAASAWTRERWREFIQTLARNRFNRLHLVFEGEPVDLDTLRFISEAAAEHGVDLALGIGAGNYEGLSKTLAACPAIRSVYAEPVEPVIRAIREAGRLVTLEISEGAADGVPLRFAVPYGKQRPGAAQALWVLPSENCTDPERVRRTAATLGGGGSAGFEIEAQPGANPLFFLAWGRLSYDPKTPMPAHRCP